MPEQTIDVLLFGFGLAGRVFHAPFLATNPAFTIAAIATSDEARAAQARGAHPGAEVRSSDALLAQAGARAPNAVSTGFNQLAFADPNLSVADCANRLGVDLRKLERTVKRDFGLSPKKVLRRARALDMAAHLLGVADHAEAEDLALRYFDQSHLNREFTEMFGMTPVQFVRTPQPLMMTTLEVRQARRLEALARLEEGARRPWQ